MEWKNKVESLKSKRAMPIVALVLVSMMLLFAMAGCGTRAADQQLGEYEGEFEAVGGEFEGEGEIGVVDGQDEDEREIEAAGGEYEDETEEEVVVAQEQPQTTPDSDQTETVIVESEEPQTEPAAQDTETDSEEPAVDPDDSDEVTVDPDEPQSVPDTSGTVLPIISLGVLLLSSGGVLLRKYKDQ